jgi:cob(I)alamin adenosyltransferase
MAIYTKTGDKGETSLANGERISKADARIEAYGTVDELNSWVGMIHGDVSCINGQLETVQNKLFNLGAALSLAPGEWISEADVEQLEGWIDAMQAELPKQHAFILPSGCEAAVRSHICRTICRRAERAMIATGCIGIELRYINRLSDYFFVLSRYLNHLQGVEESIWHK